MNIKPMTENKEYCENCKKEITGKMKDNQQVIWASAEHSLYDDKGKFSLASTDPMFNGIFCCYECYAETSGLNMMYEKGKEEFKQAVKECVLKLRAKLRLIRRFGGKKCNSNSNNHLGYDKVWLSNDWNNIEETIRESIKEDLGIDLEDKK